jgi:hypothetical protein
MSEQAVERRGRKSTEQEVRSYLAAQGLDPDQILAGTDADQPLPETPEEMRDAFMRILWSKRATLSDTALSSALTALGRLMATAKPEGPPEDEPLIADVIAGVTQLSVERRREVLKGALTRLDVERARIVEVLNA